MPAVDGQAATGMKGEGMYAYDKPDNLVELLEDSLARHSDRPLFGTPDTNGVYTWSTYGQVGRRIDDLRAGLAQLGVGEGDAVGIIANNRVEWAVAAFASFGLGARFVPMYEKELPRIWKHIIQDSGVKVIFTANETIHGQIEAFQNQLPALEHLLLIDGAATTTMGQLEETGRRQPLPALRPTPNHIAVLIYTSGTTGNPKGVLLSHGNFSSNVIAGGNRFPEVNTESRSLSILPWAHAYGLTAELFNFMHRGASMGFVRDVSTLAEDMATVAPTFLIAVPRVFNKIYDGVWTNINAKGGVAKKLFDMGLQSAARNRALASQGRRSLACVLKHKLADSVVFSKIRQRFGGQLKGALTASAMMNSEVAQFFADIGLPVFDAYGLTETSPAVTMNNREANKPGSVGRPIDKVRVVIDTSVSQQAGDEGEIVVYGPNVMQGYYNNPQATRSVMTEDGGFRTGDMGRLDDEGFLFITGRIKEQYKLENGKYVFPAAMEEEIQLLPWVENVMVYGEGRRHNVCVVIPDFAKLNAWADKQGLSTAAEDLIDNQRVNTLIRESIIDRLENRFGRYEIPKRVILADECFSIENGLLTQTLKLRRRKVLERFESQIEAAYATA